MSGVSAHIVKAFDNQLNELNDTIVRMSGLAESQFVSAIDALIKPDPQLAERVIESDSKTNELEIEVESAAVRLLALRQPMAVDLRRVISAFKMSIDLERIGDYSVNIAKRAIALEGMEPLTARDSIVNLARQVQGNLNDAIDAYATTDIQKALAVWHRDEEVDSNYGAVIEELLEAMRGDPAQVPACTHLIFIAKNVERIGDHATNVSETVQYLITGDFVEDGHPRPEPVGEGPSRYFEAGVESDLDREGEIE